MALPERVPEFEGPTAKAPGTPLLAVAAVALAALCAAAAVGAGVGNRLAMWPFRTSITILRWAAEAGLGALLLCLAALYAGRRSGAPRASILPLLGILVAAPVVALPWNMARHARQLPVIHDITTDTEDPPSFVAVLPLRAGAANPAAYGGPELAAAQRIAYPDIRPAILPVAPAEAFRRADSAARRLGWTIDAEDPAAGRIEATDTTFWMGFKDDVVIRVRAENGGSRVDVRSVSRVGKSDIGKNAERIRAFLATL